jgi:GT2 family glycosyltransferase
MDSTSYNEIRDKKDSWNRSKRYFEENRIFEANNNFSKHEYSPEYATSLNSGTYPNFSGIDSTSIIVVNHNAGSMLIDCIGYALDQAAEIIVVDNASSDGSIERLESSFGDDERLTIVKYSKNWGFATGCNIGSRIAQGEYLMYLNPDCLLSGGTVKALVSSLKQNPDAAVAGGLLLNPDGTEQGGGRRAVPTPWRSFVRGFGLSQFANRWPKLFYDFHLHRQPLPDKPIEVEAISGACMMVTRERMEQVGFWDEDYFLHCEDLDICMRLRQRKWKILFVPDAPVIHYLGICGRNKPIFVEWHKHKGMLRFYRKFFRHQYPGFLMWIVAIGVCIRFIGVTVYHAFHGTRSLPE